MADLKEKVRTRIKSLLDNVERRMRLQEHITNSEPILDLLSEVEALWSFLEESDREFIGAVRFAVRSKMRWD